VGEPNVPDLAGLHVPETLFRRQLDALLRHYTPISLARLRESRQDGRELPPSSLLLTFDDGYRNVAEHALPLLRALGVPCAWFVVAGAVESRRLLWPSELELRYGSRPDYAALKSELQVASASDRESRVAALGDDGWSPPPDCDHSLATWDELAAELRRGGVEIGSHGLRHHPLTTCEPDRLRVELRDSAALIAERLGTAVDALAYPNGAISTEVRAATAEAGYALAFTTVPRHGRSGDDALALPRILVGGRDEIPVLLARVAGWVEWLRELGGGAA
jgi:peptidoglycan/xylan/chitin deacetylase (PgdA/CDA1 family)